ncbi:hypothetical protein IMSAGC002_02643 [Lachnospiraceae bacterium]|nr:hypothetical protein IMSAGC002_02643 [Lachnospiraceae bacterium]
MKSITDRIYGLRLAVKRIEECCHSIIASIRKVKKITGSIAHLVYLVLSR